MSTVSVNTHFPGYEILGELGRSNARVLKARHVATGELVAIKHFTLGTDADTLRRFQQESTIMTSIRHPNVVRVREVQLDRPMPYIVMEWVEGGDLRTLINQPGKLDVPTLIRLGLQMAGAFSAIHPQGIIHRDIKPENILYRPLPSGELHFLLTDFGVARLREQTQTMTGQSLMTYEYASPEQFDNPRGVTPATDYYSLGVVLYECLTGRVPFSLTDNGSMALFMHQVLRTLPPVAVLPPDQFLPPSLQTLLTWALTKDPAQRLSDVTELTLLLSQANVERLQPNRSGNRPAASAVHVPTMAASVPVMVPDEENDHDALAPITPVHSYAEYWRGVIIGLLVVGVIFGFAYYYKQQQQRQALFIPNVSALPDTAAVLPNPLVSDGTEADTIRVLSNPPTNEFTTDSATIEPTATPNVSATTVSDSTSMVTDSTGVNDQH